MTENTHQLRPTAAGVLAACWGIGGLALVLTDAALRLSKYMLAAFDYEWSLLQWAVFLGNTAFMAYAEGYRGFQKSFVPRTVSRAFALSSNPSWLNGLLAPFYCVGYYGAGPRTAKVMWIGTMLIVAAVLLIRQLPQPWRGIVDAGVVVGLSWGVIAIVLITLKAIIVRRAPVVVAAGAK